MLNRFTFIGNLGQDAQVRTLDSGATAISFSVAITEKYRDKQGNTQELTTWVNCTRWVQQGGSTALAQYLRKGQKVYVEGRPTARGYVANDGQAAASLEVRVEKIELLGSAQQQGAAPQPQAQAQPQAQTSRPAHPSSPAPTSYASAPSSSEDDLPF